MKNFIQKFAAKCEYPDIRIWGNPLICSKIAKYPISESIIPSAPTLPADLIDRRRRHGIFCLTRNPSVLKKFITAAVCIIMKQYFKINLFSKVPGLLLEFLNNILQI